MCSLRMDKVSLRRRSGTQIILRSPSASLQEGKGVMKRLRIHRTTKKTWNRPNITDYDWEDMDQLARGIFRGVWKGDSRRIQDIGQR
jgi:hypothetical protein